MKTSELIRKAIDNHLSHEHVTTEQYLFLLGKQIAPYICWACIFASLGKNADIGNGLLWNVRKLPENHQDLLSIIEWETGFLSMYDVSYEETQQMRYMYADFLAYYFEDMGD